LNSWIKQSWFQGAMVGLIAAAISMALWILPVMHEWESVSWDWRVKMLARPSPSTDLIKIILIDQASLDWGSQINGLSWPWPREAYVPVIDFCRRGGAKVVAFDMLYSEPSVYSAADDVMFGESIGLTPNFVASFFMGDQATQTSTWPKDLPRHRVVIQGQEQFLNSTNASGLIELRATFPVGDVAKNAALLANVKEVPDRDGTFRRSTPVRFFDQTPVPLLGFGAFLVGSGDPPYQLSVDKQAMKVGDYKIPLDKSGQVVLRYRGPSGTHEGLSAAAIIQSELRLVDGEEPIIKPEELKDKYIFFGVSAPALKDQKPTPVSGDYPGVEIHATFLDNLLEQDFIQDANRNWVILSTFLLAIAAGVLIVRSHTVKGSVFWSILFIGTPMGVGYLAYKAGWWWPVTVQEVAVILAIGMGEIVNYATEGKQKRFIKSAFKQYLSGDVIEQILVDPGALKLGGEKRELSIFFSDLQGFSSISERLGPVDLTALLNDYLTDMSDIIMEEGGTVDKYEGDAIIAFWNAPLAQADHAIRACRAALRCQQKLAERRKEFLDRTGAEMYMRIGIHTGEVVVGNMGSNNRFNYTVLGDAANLASRLEGANKQFGTYLMVSEVTWGQAQAHFHAREIGSIMVVGRKAPVKVFDVLSLRDQPAAEYLESWNHALVCCRAGEWKEALKLLKECPDDPLTGKYKNQLERLISGEVQTWDGIWKLTEK